MSVDTKAPEMLRTPQALQKSLPRKRRLLTNSITSESGEMSPLELLAWLAFYLVFFAAAIVYAADAWRGVR